jgi:hypothetical protein
VSRQPTPQADRHTGCDRRCEQRSGAFSISGDQLAEVGAEVRPHQAAEDAAVSVEPLLHDVVLLAEVNVLHPCAEAGKYGAPGKRQRDHDPQPVVSHCAAALLEAEDCDRHDQTRADHDVVRIDRYPPERPERRNHGSTVAVTSVRVPECRRPSASRFERV